MSTIATSNRANGWNMVRVGEEWRLRRSPSTYLDYPEMWTGFVWPTADEDSDAEWRYEIRSSYSGAVLEAGEGNLRTAFQFVNAKR
ncbi:hypothetical protein ABZ128_09340 [Streptomyces sp. NPDC006326]|uniref:hypothetical protein n=1 Tax=Streptomyces sp. NPDC006326 TaxID=3156752 RepID=UPI0033AACB0E